MSSVSCGRLAAWTLAAVVLQAVGLSLFVIGFFPVKPSLPGASGLESFWMPSCDRETDTSAINERNLSPDRLRSLYREMSNISPTYERLVLMVVDGLPSEFILGRGGQGPTRAMADAMPFTQFLLSKGLARAYHAKAAPPTVTMPRLKAIISGAIGGFLDVAFNFNTGAFLDDNLLDQFYRIGWKLVMHGDDTWIKMFPKLFYRHDGVNSFYVKDTVEVDFNVSRHLEAELAANDWSLLILHYLGLDHVGHIGGRHSFMMVPKLREMDEIIKMIHVSLIGSQKIFDKPTLLLVVSDHGMTDGGNHGGSSYEETDAVALFIGLSSDIADNSTYSYNVVSQVDIAPTLSMLFGIPIPTNNVGVVLKEIINCFPDVQMLRALQLNSWQLLRLLQAHLHGLLCEGLLCATNDGLDLLDNRSIYSNEEKFCHLYLKAINAHKLWDLHQGLQNNSFELMVAFESYYNFLGNASNWLSHRATDKSPSFLVTGLVIMLVSCILMVRHLFFLLKVDFTQESYLRRLRKFVCRFCLDEVFVVFGIVVHILSLGSSSMVEEEQYTWHYLTSTLYLIFLLSTIKSYLCRKGSSFSGETSGEKHALQTSHANGKGYPTITGGIIMQCQYTPYFQMFYVSVVLICGRILRGWYQGGVNWNHLPDVSKWLKQMGDSSIRSSQITTLVLLIILALITLLQWRLWKRPILVVLLCYSVSAMLVLLYILKMKCCNALLVNLSSTLVAQIFFVVVGVTVILTVLAVPWLFPVSQGSHLAMISHCVSPLHAYGHILVIQVSSYLVGCLYTLYWCLLQLLLQQPVNAIPIVLLLLQLLATRNYFRNNSSHHSQYVKVSALYFLGMTNHFGLGNSNSLATIDVVGAFIGVSSHSTLFSGVLMFIITYASPLLFLLGIMMCIASEDMWSTYSHGNSNLTSILQMWIAIPCLLPLVFNSLVLTAFTIILMVMRNHLFVWSVFSPKFLYVCAGTVCVYMGVLIVASTALYICAVAFYRANNLNTKALTQTGKQQNPSSF